jgi:hypothetical protein
VKAVEKERVWSGGFVKSDRRERKKLKRAPSARGTAALLHSSLPFYLAPNAPLSLAYVCIDEPRRPLDRISAIHAALEEERRALYLLNSSVCMRRRTGTRSRDF